MTEAPSDAARALREHSAFEETADGYVCTTTPFDATVDPLPADAEGRDAQFRVVVELPTLDAVVADETVADVVADGWFETLELRLADAYDVAEVDPVADLEIDRGVETIVVQFHFIAWDADRGAESAKAIVNYVEGTYLQGVIPGYEYDEPVAGLLARASEQASSENGGATRGGTPL